MDKLQNMKGQTSQEFNEKLQKEDVKNHPRVGNAYQKVVSEKPVSRKKYDDVKRVHVTGDRVVTARQRELDKLQAMGNEPSPAGAPSTQPTKRQIEEATARLQAAKDKQVKLADRAASRKVEPPEK